MTNTQTTIANHINQAVKSLCHKTDSHLDQIIFDLNQAAKLLYSDKKRSFTVKLPERFEQTITTVLRQLLRGKQVRSWTLSILLHAVANAVNETNTEVKYHMNNWNLVVKFPVELELGIITTICNLMQGKPVVSWRIAWLLNAIANSYMTSDKYSIDDIITS